METPYRSKYVQLQKSPGNPEYPCKIQSVFETFSCWGNLLFYRRNIIDKINKAAYLQTCRYNKETDQFCPIFEVGKIVKAAGQNFTQLAFEVCTYMRLVCLLAKYCTTVYSSKLDTSLFSKNSTNTHSRPTKPFCIELLFTCVTSGD